MASSHAAVSSCSRADFAQLACRGFASISKDSSVSLEDKASTSTAAASAFPPLYHQRQCPVFALSTFESSISSLEQPLKPIYQSSSAPSSCFLAKASRLDRQHRQRLRGSSSATASQQLFECRYRSSSPSHFSAALDARAHPNGSVEPPCVRPKATARALQKTLRASVFPPPPASAQTKDQLDHGSSPSLVRVAAVFDLTHSCSSGVHTASESSNGVSTAVAWGSLTPTADAHEVFSNLPATPIAVECCQHLVQPLLVVSPEKEESHKATQPQCFVPSSVSPTTAPSSPTEKHSFVTPRGFGDLPPSGTPQASVTSWDQTKLERDRGRKPPRVAVPELRLTPACGFVAEDFREITNNDTRPHQPGLALQKGPLPTTRLFPGTSTPRLATDDTTWTPVSARSESKAQWTEVSMGTWRRHDSPSPPVLSGHSVNFGSPSPMQRSDHLARGSGTGVTPLLTPQTPSTESVSIHEPPFLDPHEKRPPPKPSHLLRPSCAPESGMAVSRDSHQTNSLGKFSSSRALPTPDPQPPELGTNAAGSEVTGRFVQQRLQARRAFGRAATILHQHLAPQDMAVLRAASPFGGSNAAAGLKKNTDTQDMNKDTLKFQGFESVPSLTQQYPAPLNASETSKDLLRQRSMTGAPTPATASQASWAAAYAAATIGRGLSPADLKQRKEKYLLQATASQAEALALLPAILHQHKLRSAQRRATGQFSVGPTMLLTAGDATDVGVVHSQSANV